MLKNVWYRMWAVVDDMIKSTSVHHWGGLFCCCYRSAWNIFWAPLKSWIIKVMQLQNMFGRSCLISCFSWCCFKACVYSSLHLQQKKCWSYHLMFLSTSTFYKKDIKKKLCSGCLILPLRCLAFIFVGTGAPRGIVFFLAWWVHVHPCNVPQLTSCDSEVLMWLFGIHLCDCKVGNWNLEE